MGGKIVYTGGPERIFVTTKKGTLYGKREGESAFSEMDDVPGLTLNQAQLRPGDNLELKVLDEQGKTKEKAFVSATNKDLVFDSILVDGSNDFPIKLKSRPGQWTNLTDKSDIVIGSRK